MVITHNMTAMNGNRQLGIVTKRQAKSSEKLSSGYRINRAADDAAGLTISEKMRSQIRGLNQASSNAQDGVSLAQIAEGAMGEVHDMLHRMTELAVKSSTGTNTTADRNAMQKEISALTEEIDRIAESTEYNTLKLIDGSMSSGASSEAKSKLLNNIFGSWIKDGLDTISSRIGWNLNTDISIDVKFEPSSADGNAMAAMGFSNGGNQFTLYIYENQLSNDTSYGASGPNSGGMYFDRVLTHEMTHALMGHNNSSDTAIPDWFVEGIAEAVHGSDDYRFGTYGNTSVQSAYDDLQAFNFNSGTSSIDDYSVGMLAVSYLRNYETTHAGSGVSAGAWNDLLTALKNPADTSTFADKVNTAYGVNLGTILGNLKSESKAAYDGGGGNNVSAVSDFFKNNCQIIVGDTSPDPLGVAAPSGLDQESTVANTGSETNINPNGDTLTYNGHSISMKWPDIAENHAMSLQIGAAAEHHMEFSIGSMNSAVVLGANGIDISTQGGARDALQIIQDGLDYVSEERSKLGAVQNRLEHTIANLDNVVENTTAAESRIRDVDMATEMVEYSKNQILQQAGQSMLAQANQQTSGVLSLLQ